MKQKLLKVTLRGVICRTLEEGFRMLNLRSVWLLMKAREELFEVLKGKSIRIIMILEETLSIWIH